MNIANPNAALDQAAALRQAGQHGAAEQVLREAARRWPGQPAVLGNLGNLLRQTGRPADAATFFAELCRLVPGMPVAHYSLGNALSDQRLWDGALSAYATAVRLDPAYGAARVNWANALRTRGQPGDLDAAITHYESAVHAQPTLAEGWLGLASALTQAERIGPAIAAYERLRALVPNQPGTMCDEASLRKDIGQIEAALPLYKQAAQLAPDSPLVQDCLLMALTYAGADPDLWMAAHRNYGDHLAARVPRLPPPPPPDRNGRRLRVGYVSGDLRGHSIANFIWPVLQHHDRQSFEIFAYATQSAGDQGSELIRQTIEHWIDAATLDDDALAARIRADGIDLLIDLASHTGHNRLPVFARRPAPVQATWLGYAATTGLPMMDWRITDADIDPPGDTERWHTERLWRLPVGSFCFSPSPHCPPIAPLPKSDRIVLASFANSAKLTSRVIALWARILAAVPDAELLIQLRGGDEPGIAAAMRARFTAHGIAAERITPFGRRAFGDFMALHGTVHLALDPLTFSGVTTTFYTLWMGVPVLTLPGELPITRASAAILKRLDMTACIAENETDYVARAVTLASDRARLAEWRSDLRERMRGSSAMNAPAFTRALEAAYAAIIQPPEA